MPRDLPKHLPQPKTFCVFDFIALKGGGHFMSFVADNQIPLFSAQLQFEIISPRNGIDADDAMFDGTVRRKTIAVENLERQAEFGKQFVLPLFDETAGANDETTMQGAAND